ncbi:sulfur carrier protein ThiS adenylyltransferase ThiF [Megasphaera vaginalis (ex Bordigoni et al. 2020)]|uniref:sulfur carrier protein ThiS adenylyltransferase ThiF n=1 Tax=Megasphaera vaginalis (ex Bordigoni et al. 2020) TaxID=2045301 RepID=UPI000C7A7A7C|nr:sulfur carrier protein ThiS adenylyltransferase ThiF [Megasphaera vaginalis (ex Bordigoni et al. 2020)]
MKIKLNGKETVTAAGHLYGLPHPAHAVIILNGYGMSADAPLADGDEVYIISKDELPPQDALERMLCARHTPQVYEKVKAATVAIAGLGGLGSNVAVYLARCGIGGLHLVDFDTVDVSNLNRQSYFIRDLGEKKTFALARQLREINPFLKIRTDNVKVTAENAVSLFAGDPLICEAFDGAEAKAMLVNTMLTECPDKYIVAASGMAGYGDSNAIKTRKVTDRLYVCGDGSHAARPGRGLMAPRVAICAAHEANMILKILVDLR